MVSKGQRAPSPLLQPPKAAQPKDRGNQEPPNNPQTAIEGLETPAAPQAALGTEAPRLSPSTQPQVSQTPKDANVELGERGAELWGGGG